MVFNLPAALKMDPQDRNTPVGALDEDEEGYVICPDCFTCIHCGPVGITNLETWYRA